MLFKSINLCPQISLQARPCARVLSNLPPTLACAHYSDNHEVIILIITHAQRVLYIKLKALRAFSYY